MYLSGLTGYVEAIHYQNSQVRNRKAQELTDAKHASGEYGLSNLEAAALRPGDRIIAIGMYGEDTPYLVTAINAEDPNDVSVFGYPEEEVNSGHAHATLHEIRSGQDTGGGHIPKQDIKRPPAGPPNKAEPSGAPGEEPGASVSDAALQRQAEGIRARAEAAAPELNRIGEEIAKEVGGRWVAGPVKSAARMVEQARDHNPADPAAELAKTNNGLRGSLVVPDPQSYEAAAKELAKRAVEIDNSLETPKRSGYQGWHATLDVNGVRAEVQLHTEASFELTHGESGQHADYEAVRPWLSRDLGTLTPDRRAWVDAYLATTERRYAAALNLPAETIARISSLGSPEASNTPRSVAPWSGTQESPSNTSAPDRESRSGNQTSRPSGSLDTAGSSSSDTAAPPQPPADSTTAAAEAKQEEKAPLTAEEQARDARTVRLMDPIQDL